MIFYDGNEMLRENVRKSFWEQMHLPLPPALTPLIFIAQRTHVWVDPNELHYNFFFHSHRTHSFASAENINVLREFSNWFPSVCSNCLWVTAANAPHTHTHNKYRFPIFPLCLQRTHLAMNILSDKGYWFATYALIVFTSSFPLLFAFARASATNLPIDCSRARAPSTNNCVCTVNMNSFRAASICPFAVWRSNDRFLVCHPCCAHSTRYQLSHSNYALRARACSNCTVGLGEGRRRKMLN